MQKNAAGILLIEEIHIFITQSIRNNRLMETVIVIGIVNSAHAGLQYMRSIRKVRVKR
jgi:hypothetical protein